MLDWHATLLLSASLILTYRFFFSETDPRASEAFHVQERNQRPEALALVCETAREGTV